MVRCTVLQKNGLLEDGDKVLTIMCASPAHRVFRLLWVTSILVIVLDGRMPLEALRPVLAAIGPGLKEEIAALRAKIDDAGRLYKQDQLARCRVKILQAQKAYEELVDGASAELRKELQPSYARIKKAHALLKAKQVSMPALPDPPQTAGKKAATKTGDEDPSAPAGRSSRVEPDRVASQDASSADESPSGDESPSNDPSAESSAPQPAPPRQRSAREDDSPVSFTRQVAPILVAHCGRCHVQGKRGDFSMANYASLMEGGPTGPCIIPGQPSESMLVEQIESGEMPPRGSVPEEEIAQIRRWIEQGAKFDGDDTEAKLTSFAK
jgi:hypothetical protein